MDKIKDFGYWVETLPEVWLSLPDPNKVEVDIYLYDKAGHKSNSVKLIDQTRQNDWQEEYRGTVESRLSAMEEWREKSKERR